MEIAARRIARADLESKSPVGGDAEVNFDYVASLQLPPEIVGLLDITSECAHPHSRPKPKKYMLMGIREGSET